MAVSCTRSISYCAARTRTSTRACTSTSTGPNPGIRGDAAPIAAGMAVVRRRHSDLLLGVDRVTPHREHRLLPGNRDAHANFIATLLGVPLLSPPRE